MFSFLKKKKLLVTHSGKFHADDIFSCATLELVLEQQGYRTEVIRTRDEAIMARADFVFDVGGEYDHERGRYDHHQRGGAGEHENGIPYAAFGLIWKHYGDILTGNTEVTQHIANKLVQPIDADDNGVQIYECVRPDVAPRTLQSMLYVFRPTWCEGMSDALYDERFRELVDLAKKILAREIKVCTDTAPVCNMIRAVYEATEDKRILELHEEYPWEPFIDEYDGIIYVIYERSNTWRVQGVATSKGSYVLRKRFPENWAGLRDQELVEVSGVPDALFCHNARFLAVAKSLEGARALAKKL
ncbi:MAG: MYG1 family protein [Candidatus Pacebacteria bacterium]|nr:MYG1 family protein [Candidatus Paceibacterota bacterium]